MGDRFAGVAGFAEWIHRYNAVLVSVEYRLAPEFPDPYPVEDCYAGLVWTAENAEELGIESERLMIAGGSAGGGLAAGVALLARERRGPQLIGQMLMYPMLDDRDATVSTRQIDGVGVWDRGAICWAGARCLVNAGPPTMCRSMLRPREPPTSPTCPRRSSTAAAPRSSATRTSPTPRRSGRRRPGRAARLAGAFHASESLAPQAALSHDAVDARDRWIRRLLG